MKTSKEDTVVLDDSSVRNSSSRNKSNHSSKETGKTSIFYDSDSAYDDKISTSSISIEDDIWLDGCRDAFIIDKLKTNSKSNLKQHTLGSNNLDIA